MTETTSQITLLHEDFDGGPETVVTNHFEVKSGHLVTDGNDDGVLLFESVDLTGLSGAVVSLEAKILGGSFEDSGSAADELVIEFVTEGGIIVLDVFEGTGQTLTGSLTGQTITDSLGLLSYALPEGLGAGQVRLRSDISARSEKIKIDSVKITADGTPPEPVEPPEGQICVDFAGLAAGEGGNLVLEGVTFEAIRSRDTDGVFDDAMIFDAANPTGGDSDLFQPSLGNVLIISEDGDSANPDDDARGGTIVATFDEPSTVNSITLLDTETPGARVDLFAEDGTLLASFSVPTIPNGDAQVLSLGDTEGVKTVEVNFPSSGAIDELKFTTPAIEPAQFRLEKDIVETDEATSVALNVLDNDTASEGAMLSVLDAGFGLQVFEFDTPFEFTSQFGNRGTLTISSDGSVTYDLSDDFLSLTSEDRDVVTFTYFAADTNGNSDGADVAITINGLDDALL